MPEKSLYPNHPALTSRQQDVVERYLRGDSMTEIARVFDVPRARIESIIRASIRVLLQG